VNHNYGVVGLACSMKKNIFKWKEDFSMKFWINNFASLKPEDQDQWRRKLEPGVHTRRKFFWVLINQVSAASLAKFYCFMHKFMAFSLQNMQSPQNFNQDQRVSYFGKAIITLHLQIFCTSLFFGIEFRFAFKILSI